MGHKKSLKHGAFNVQVMREERQAGERQPRGGCTAAIRKLQRHDNGIWPATLKVLAEGVCRPKRFSSSDCLTVMIVCKI